MWQLTPVCEGHYSWKDKFVIFFSCACSLLSSFLWHLNYKRSILIQVNIWFILISSWKIFPFEDPSSHHLLLLESCLLIWQNSNITHYTGFFFCGWLLNLFFPPPLTADCVLCYFLILHLFHVVVVTFLLWVCKERFDLWPDPSVSWWQISWPYIIWNDLA